MNLCQVTKNSQKEKEEKLWHFLRSIPYCELSEKAYHNYARRFNLDVDIFRAFVDLERQNREGGSNV